MTTLPPTSWIDPRECPCKGCDETRFTSLGMDYHLIRDHGDGGARTVPEQVAEAGRT
jgi:hypothetical protein